MWGLWGGYATGWESCNTLLSASLPHFDIILASILILPKGRASPLAILPDSLVSLHITGLILLLPEGFDYHELSLGPFLPLMSTTFPCPWNKGRVHASEHQVDLSICSLISLAVIAVERRARDCVQHPGVLSKQWERKRKRQNTFVTLQ